MKNLDEGPDGLDDSAFDRAWDRAIRDDAARRAARLPARRRQPIPVIPTADLDARLDAHFEKFAPTIDAINAGFAATGDKP